MAQATALYLALDLLHRPTLAGLMREQPLPQDVLMLIKIAAGDIRTEQRVLTMTSHSREHVREAAILYLQHVLLAPGADNYRVLGVQSDAPQHQLREHLGWLMRWLHPDRTRSEWDSVFAERVLTAWDTLKTAERRARYDRSVVDRIRTRPKAGTHQHPRIAPLACRIPWIPQQPDPSDRKRTRRRGFALLLIGATVAVVLLSPRWLPWIPWQG
jgi:hypothetical protein